MSHRLDALLTDRQRSDFWAIVGQEPGNRTDALWERRPRERFAEYVSAALWDVPIDSRMEPVSQEMLALIRGWAEKRSDGGGRATVRLMTDTTVACARTAGPDHPDAG